LSASWVLFFPAFWTRLRIVNERLLSLDSANLGIVVGLGVAHVVSAIF
jgi:hypothetical protein